MRIKNNTSFTVVARGWVEDRGFGPCVQIPAKEEADVDGPEDQNSATGYVLLPYSLTCHEGPDSVNGFQVGRTRSIDLKHGGYGIEIYHREHAAEIGLSPAQTLSV